ncbi:MAG: hypothetical protein ABH874_06175 [Methanobacteriota archaeon]
MIEQKIDEIFKILKKHDDRIKELEALAKGGQLKPVEVSLDQGIKKLAADAGITEEQLKHVFDFEEEDLNLIAAIEGNEAEKQCRATICILTALDYCYGKDIIESKILRKKLEKLGISSLNNLSTNLAKFANFIVPKGEPGSPNFCYKITLPGKKKGLEIIRELASA